MAKISSYPVNININMNDILIGSDINKETKNFKIDDLVKYLSGVLKLPEYSIFENRSEYNEFVEEGNRKEGSLYFIVSENSLYIFNSNEDEITIENNLLIFNTKEEADIFITKNSTKEGVLVYLKSTSEYLKLDSNKILVDPLPNKLDKPTIKADSLDVNVVVLNEDGDSVFVPASELVDDTNYVKKNEDNKTTANFRISNDSTESQISIHESNRAVIKSKNTKYEFENETVSGGGLMRRSEFPDAGGLTQRRNFKIDDKGISGETQITGEVPSRFKLKYVKTTNIGKAASFVRLPTTNYYNENPTDSDFKILAISVNGNLADEEGNIEVSVPEVNLSDYYNKGEVDTKFSELPKQEFIKDGLGWALKYKRDNPAKYVPTGENAIDLTKAYANSAVNFGASGKDSFAAGSYNLAAGLNSISMGYSTRAYADLGIVIGYNSIAYSPFTTIIGGFRNTIGYEGLLTAPVSGLNNRSVILGGFDNKIIKSQFSNILGGGNNTIDAGDDYLANVTAYNNILGGYNNKVIKKASRSNILGGQNNISQGWYNNVTGIENHAVTLGESIFGTYATIQDTNLPPDAFGNRDSNYRMFAVGIGGELNSSSYRADGLNVYKSGLVTAPSLTNKLIENNNDSLITLSYFNEHRTPTLQEVLDNGLATATITKTFDITSNNFTVSAGCRTDIGGGTTFLLSTGAYIDVNQGSRFEMNQAASAVIGNNGQISFQSAEGRIELLSEMVGARDESFSVKGTKEIITIDKNNIIIKNSNGKGLEIPSNTEEGLVLVSDAQGVFKPKAILSGGGVPTDFYEELNLTGGTETLKDFESIMKTILCKGNSTGDDFYIEVPDASTHLGKTLVLISLTGGGSFEVYDKEGEMITNYNSGGAKTMIATTDGWVVIYS